MTINNNKIESANQKLSNSIDNLEKTIHNKIEQIRTQNRINIANNNKQHNEEKTLLKHKINELSNSNSSNKATGRIIINEIRSELEKIKNILKNNNRI